MSEKDVRAMELDDLWDEFNMDCDEEIATIDDRNAGTPAHAGEVSARAPGGDGSPPSVPPGSIAMESVDATALRVGDRVALSCGARRAVGVWSVDTLDARCVCECACAACVCVCRRESEHRRV